MSKTKLNVNELEVVLYKQDEEEYISLTDMAKFRDSEKDKLYHSKLDENKKYD